MNLDVLSPASSRHTPGMSVSELPNRQVFRERLDEAVGLAERQARAQFAVLLLDVVLDPDMGLIDMDVLNDIAAAIRSTVRLTDTVAFLSGSEFAVLLSIGNEGGAVRVAGKIAEGLAALGFAEVAIGLSIFDLHSRESEALLRAAEGALYQARRGYQKVVVGVKTENAYIPTQDELEQRIDTAIQQDEIVLHYQPIVRLQSGVPVSLEALARWHHPGLGLLPPAEFLHLAEKEGRIEELNFKLIERALTQVLGWRERGISLSMSLNLSPGMLLRETLGQDILRRLHERGLEPDCLTVELRDDALAGLSQNALKSLFDLASAGVCVSIDDFGRGTASLMSLRDLPVQEIKIDPAFAAQVCRSEADAAIVSALVMLARRLGKFVVAKGVESEEVRVKLCELGCEYGQGYHFARAMGADEVEGWCVNRKLVA